MEIKQTLKLGSKPHNNYVTAILTAAGLSSRMKEFKPLLQWRQTTLLEYQIMSLFDGGVDEVIVVAGYNYQKIKSYVNNTNASVVFNNRFADGRTTSIIEGLKFVPPATNAILILGVDQPRNSAIINNLINEHFCSGRLITYPSFQSRGGHPIIFSSVLKKELMLISEESTGLRLITEKYKDCKNKVEMKESLVQLDLNTIDEYRHAFLKWGT